MADFQGWERQVLPQGKLVAPQTGPSLAEAFGSGLSDLANATAATVESVRKTDEWRDEKQWEIDQPKAAALVNKLQTQFGEQMPDIEANAAPDLADYPDKINDAITQITEEGLKDNPDPRFQRYVRAYMDDFRTSSVITGIQKKTAATLANDASALQQLVDGQSARVIKDFASFESAASLVVDTISKNPHFTADQKAELTRTSKQALAIKGLSSLIERDAGAAQQVINSGKLDGILSTADKEGFLADIKSEQERKATQARISEENRIHALRIEVGANLQLAFDQAFKTGKYDKVTRSSIIDAYGEARGKEIIADLDNTRYIGQDALAIANQSARSDSQLLRMLSDVASKNKDDRRAQDRLDYAQKNVYLKRTGLKSNPEMYAREHSAAVQEKWDAFAKNPYDLATTRLAIETPIQVQRRLGVAEERLDPVSQAAADIVFEKVKQNGSAAIARFQKNFGDQFSHVIGKLVSKGPLFTAALMLDHPGQAATQAALLDLDRDPQSLNKLATTLGVDAGGKAEVDKLVDRNLDDLRQSYANQPGGETAFFNLRAATYALTLRHMSLDKMNAGDAAKTAAREIGMNYYEFSHIEGKVYRIPKDAYQYEVILGAHAYIASLEDLDIQFDPVDGAPEIESAQIARSLASSGYWVNLPDDSGLKLVFPTGQPVKAGGKDIALTWFQLVQAATDYAQ